MGHSVRLLAHLETPLKKLNYQKIMSPRSLKTRCLLVVSRQTLKNVHMRAGREETKSQMTRSSIKIAYLFKVAGCVLITRIE